MCSTYGCVYMHLQKAMHEMRPVNNHPATLKSYGSCQDMLAFFNILIFLKKCVENQPKVGYVLCVVM